MSAAEFTVQYPVFVLKAESGAFACLELPGDEGAGLMVFTTESNATAFLRASGLAGQVRALDREDKFRGLVQTLKAGVRSVIFDPRHRKGMVRFKTAFPRAVLVERYLSETAWGWEYPVFVLRGWVGYKCLNGNYKATDGSGIERPLKFVVVLTDSDLAEREIGTDLTRGWAAVPIESREAFARFARGLPPDVAGAVFDPPTARGGWKVMTCKLRDRLIANLEAEI